ncbi:hypothetical protein [Erythrobacter sp. R86502]|uniref:hypothetical protein n=1 Tax=Erythrobacter sp. R86502 TaxID=3093846 RepID=UPI0036D40293
MKLEIRHLEHFNNLLKRDVLVDALSRPAPVPDQALLMRVIEYGNTFLERNKPIADRDGAVIFFDCHWGEPAQLGISWAYNPHAPYDDLYGVAEFWRLWSEIPNMTDGKVIYSLAQCQYDLAAYQLQHMAGAAR